MSWYFQVLKKYAVFDGRAGRSEFWYWALFNFIISFVLSFISRLPAGYSVPGIIYGLAVLLPFLGVGIRRLHDTGRSGWWMLLEFIPLIGQIWLIVYWASASEEGTNKYGPSPKLAANPV